MALALPWEKMTDSMCPLSTKNLLQEKMAGKGVGRSLKSNGKPIADYRRTGGYNFETGRKPARRFQFIYFQVTGMGAPLRRSNTKADYQANSVLYKDVIETGGKKKPDIGCTISFKATAGLSPNRSTEVEETLDYFEAAGIEELILDLRYNGGGSVDVAEQIMNGLIPAAADGELMYTNALNEEKNNLNEVYRF